MEEIKLREKDLKYLAKKVSRNVVQNKDYIVTLADNLREVEAKMLEEQNKAIETNRKLMLDKMQELEKMMLEAIKTTVYNEMKKQLNL